MGLYDRDYTQDDYQQRYQYPPRMRIGFPRITPVVKKLLIINAAVFLIDKIFFKPEFIVPPFLLPISFFDKWFSVFPYSLASTLQLWRILTYQFLHADIWHIFINMLCLYFLGPTLERHWRAKKFLIFYLCCGAAGGVFYTLLVSVNFLGAAPMVGASGSILGLLASCAILFPQFVVFIFFFPVPIRVAAVGLTLVYIFIVATRGENAGGEAAHLAGMVVGAAYVLSKPLRAKWLMKTRAERWNKQRDLEQQIQQELDRILEKVHNSGIHSLSAKEKKILKEATRLEQTKNRL